MEEKQIHKICKSIDGLTKAVKENTKASKSKEDAIWWLGDAVAGLVEFLSQHIQIVEHDVIVNPVSAKQVKLKM